MANEYLLILLCGYLLGSIPVASLLMRFRECGWFWNRHLQMVNVSLTRIIQPVFRYLPAHWESTAFEGWPVVLGNFLKGFLAVLLARVVIGSEASMVFTGIMAIWGHTWPVFLRFRSERGSAVILGASFIAAPITTLIWCGFWVVFFALTRYAAIASLLSYTLFPLLLWWVRRRDLFVVYGVVCAILAAAQLVGDIQRIASGRSKSADEGGAMDESEMEEAEEEEDPPVRQSRLKARLALGLIAGLLVLMWFGNKYVYRGFGLQVPMIRAGGSHYKAVSLTFDDGPDPIWTPKILDVLKQHNVKATFFVVGRHVEKYPEIARRIIAEGHEIGNHSYSHPNLILLPKERLLQEITKSEEAITKATGQRPYLFRPPRGLYNKALMDFLLERKYTMVLWTVSSRDWQEPSFKEITWRITTGVKPGAIVLFHDSGSIISPDGGNRECTVQALPHIIRDLREKGYRFATIRDMIIMSDLNGHIQ